MVYKHSTEIDFAIADLPIMPFPGRVLMTTPDYFDIAYVINPHMEGNLGNIDHEEARRQWDALRNAYECLSFELSVLDGVPGYPDMVFCANQTLPYITPGTKERGVLLSNMFAEQRRGEVPYLASFFERQGYQTRAIENDGPSFFEGMGDAIWHPGRSLLWGGYGHRTDARVYDRISDFLQMPVVQLELIDPEFYHLDTCFSALDAETVLIFPNAFTETGIALIHKLFKTVLIAPEREARSLFACNAHCPDRHHVFLQRGCNETTAALRKADFEPVELDTGEFLKSGASVFCMKLMYW